MDGNKGISFTGCGLIIRQSEFTRRRESKIPAFFCGSGEVGCKKGFCGAGKERFGSVEVAGFGAGETRFVGNYVHKLNGKRIVYVI